MSVDGSSITREDLENFYTACENNATLPVCIHQAFWRVCIVYALREEISDEFAKVDSH